MSRFAVIGAGPAGIYAANILLAADPDARVDLYERLPAPYGLVRYGVAPDHPRIKGVVNSLSEMLENERIRLFCGVNYGEHLSLEDLRAHYNGVIFATGAIEDARLNIPGIEVEGSFGAADFVSWYDGHPDYSRTWPLQAKVAAVIGNGNVALDMARVLIKPAPDLKPTEVPDNVYELLEQSALTDLHVFGRRGPLDVKFTPLELRELGEVNDMDIILDEEDFAHPPAGDEPLSKQMLVIDRVFSAWRRREHAGASRRLHFHFYATPKALLAEDGKLSGLQYTKRLPDGRTEERQLPIQAFYRAVGYYGSPLADLPFDAAAGVVPNQGGRVLIEGQPAAGCYVTGWIKRGPVGLIGHTKSDAMETIDNLLSDRASWWQPQHTDPEAVNRLLDERGVPHTGLAGWRRLDAHEVSLGEQEGRERKKVVPRDEMHRISQGH